MLTIADLNLPNEKRSRKLHGLNNPDAMSWHVSVILKRMQMNIPTLFMENLPKCICIQEQIQGVVHWDPIPFKTEQVRNTKVCSTLSIHTYSDAAHLSVRITASCPRKHKHSHLQIPRDSSVAVPEIQKLIPNRRGSEKRPYDELPKLHSSYHKFLRGYGGLWWAQSTVICSKFSWDAWPQAYNCVYYTCTDNYVLHMSHHPPLLLQFLDPPLASWSVSLSSQNTTYKVKTWV